MGLGIRPKIDEKTHKVDQEAILAQKLTFSLRHRPVPSRPVNSNVVAPHLFLDGMHKGPC